MGVARGKPRGLLATKQDGGILGTYVPKSKGRADESRQKRRRPTRLAEKLSDVRARLGLSQGDMVRRLGLEEELERDYISKYERGILEPPLHVLCAYADVANVFLDVLARDYLDLPDKLPSAKRHEGVKRRQSKS
jgi:DNA-binding XRE family transcriptional regulator